jgi:hypothetical protein
LINGNRILRISILRGGKKMSNQKPIPGTNGNHYVLLNAKLNDK